LALSASALASFDYSDTLAASDLAYYSFCLAAAAAAAAASGV